MDLVAPNLAALIGEIIGARLISHAGVLQMLCCWLPYSSPGKAFRTARQLDEFGQVPRQHRADLGRREGLVSRLENQGAAVLRG